MGSLLSALKTFCEAQGDKTYWVGFSGGLDSHVLLHLLARLQAEKPLKLQGIHIHHGLSPNANAWQAHCDKICRELKIPLQTHAISLQVTKKNCSLEEMARDLRYEKFSAVLQEQDILLTAHHQDDQAETVLIQLLRGAGPKGLSGMPPLKKLGKGWHARPLLSFTREELKQYAEQYQLAWIEDESNQNHQFTRNFLRGEILPLLKKRWPTVTTTLARVADNCADNQIVLNEMIENELQQMQGVTSGTLSIPKLLTLDAAKQKLMLRAWLLALDLSLPSAVKLEQIQKSLHARHDKTPLVTWSTVEVRRFNHELYAMQQSAPHDATQQYEWDLQSPLTLPGIGVLQSMENVPIIEKVTVRFRQGGERILLRGHHHTLKNLLQEWGVPPWQRDRLPLVFAGEVLAAVPGYAVADGLSHYFEQILHSGLSHR